MIAPHLAQNHDHSSPLHIEDSPKRLRVLFGGKYIIDTLNAKLVFLFLTPVHRWEKPYYPTYFFSQEDLPKEYLRKSSGLSSGFYDIVVGDRKASGSVQKFDDKETDGKLGGLLKITFAAMDAWFEEDEQVFVHPKDPYKRVDVLQSSRHIKVEVKGVKIAETTKPRMLFETSLPVRYYIPKTDFVSGLLVPSETTSECPYKGVANYYSVQLPSGELVKDVIWWYRTPQPECGEIKGFGAVWSEKVDVWVDGVKV